MKNHSAVEQRFWAKVEPMMDDRGCWVWSGARTRQGYGHLACDGQFIRASRLSWLIHNGEIPPDLCVLHRCDNPPCVNPAHLWLGTKRDNTRDMLEKGRGFSLGRTKTACPRGHAYDGVRKNGSERYCLTCQRAATAKWRADKRSSANA